MDFKISSFITPSMIIRLYILLSAAVSSKAVPEVACNRIKIGENWYDRDTLWGNIGRPYNLNVHRGSNSLFFSYSLPETYSDVDFQLAYFNIDTREYQTIAGIRGGCSVAIDQMNDDIYLGGSDGIYKYNMLTKLADFYKEKGKNIWSLFFKKNLFYISYPDQKLHIEFDGKFATVKEFENFEIDYFHVSSANVIYFANKTGLYKYDNDKMVAQVVNELITVRQIVEDNEGDTYIVSNFGVFADGKFEGLKKILDMKNIYGLAFDKDNNFIYSDEKNIIKLEYSVVGCDKKHVHW
ncbi:ommochrome-binding protein [Helicoverpa armigera]|uniref:ommochrome-binding protein n=1 Tax=Helicoverpa armigera TaxID=29058 RepID=UPI0021126837|nr:ommochrome-binding protein [Helicoverpa armigera]